MTENLKKMLSTKNFDEKLTPELRRICSTTQGMDGPILKYTEIFQSPTPPLKRRKCNIIFLIFLNIIFIDNRFYFLFLFFIFYICFIVD